MTDESIVTPGGVNIFEDLGFPDAKELLVKANLSAAIQREIKSRGLRQVDAAKIMGIRQPDVSDIIRGRLDDFSIERLIRLLDKLGFDVQMSIVRKTA